jgi:hypothetical protein
MRVARIVLLILLGLTAMMQCLEGLASISNPAGMMAGLNLTMSPDVQVPLTFLGVAMIVRAAVTAIALFWIIQRKPEGLFLARFTALTILLSAPVVYWKLHRADFAGGDLIQGLLLLVPALIVTHQVDDSTIQRFEDSRR